MLSFSNIISVFSREAGSSLAARAVEVSFACALSTVGESGHHVGSTKLLESQLLDYLCEGDDTM